MQHLHGIPDEPTTPLLRAVLDYNAGAPRLLQEQLTFAEVVAHWFFEINVLARLDRRDGNERVRGPRDK